MLLHVSYCRGIVWRQDYSQHTRMFLGSSDRRLTLRRWASRRCTFAIPEHFRATALNFLGIRIKNLIYFCLIKTCRMYIVMIVIDICIMVCDNHYFQTKVFWESNASVSFPWIVACACVKNSQRIPSAGTRQSHRYLFSHSRVQRRAALCEFKQKNNVKMLAFIVVE